MTNRHAEWRRFGFALAVVAASLWPTGDEALQAGERTASMAVSVQVVATCDLGTGPGGLLTNGCAATNAPLAVRVDRIAATDPALGAGGGPIALDGGDDTGGLVTVIY